MKTSSISLNAIAVEASRLQWNMSDLCLGKQSILDLRFFKGVSESQIDTCRKMTHIICAESGPLQSLLPSLDRSSRCSNLGRALSPEHASESAGSRSGESSSGPLEHRL